MNTPTPETNAIDSKVGDWNAADYYGAMLQLSRKLEQQRDSLKAALKVVLDSAFPHPEENPAMFKAWTQARAVLAAIQTESEVVE